MFQGRIRNCRKNLYPAGSLLLMIDSWCRPRKLSNPRMTDRARFSVPGSFFRWEMYSDKSSSSLSGNRWRWSCNTSKNFTVYCPPDESQVVPKKMQLRDSEENASLPITETLDSIDDVWTMSNTEVNTGRFPLPLFQSELPLSSTSMPENIS